MKNWMEEALNMAKRAYKKNEVPIGAVIVKDGKIISKAYNQREKKQNAIKHAEIIAIDKACKKLKSWRLDGCTLFVTLEPCPMCSGAICNARIDKVVYASSEKTSQDNLCEMILQSNRLNHKVLLEQEKNFEREASNLLTSFFKEKRQIKK